MVALSDQHDEVGDDERVDDRHAVRQRLLAEQAPAAVVEHARLDDARAAEEVRLGEEADEQRADEPADEVHADDVEGVVVARLGLQPDGEAADDAGDQRRSRSATCRPRSRRRA